ncbi:PD-(D/E)XK nuclease-like domain-containing protein [Dactylosporangium sp. NPDC000244]|uniref:PD-(D/E)XK nuclease-like domain-containing protein n=1 Tax=Dactylosporangium sp. NPDC000244 TaxID=3154365 RepID=UPI00331EFA35
MTAVLPERLVIDQPGVYDLDEVTYFADPVPTGSLSASGAKLLLPPSCPALFRYAADNPPKTKRVFDLGHAAHKLVLGVGAELVAVDADNWLTKKAKEAAAEARAEGKIPLLAREVAQVKAMAAAIRRNPLASKLLDPAHGKPEQSIFWHDRQAGIWRRARLDWLPEPGRGRFVIPDYKTAQSANPADFAKAVHTYRYHLQDRWYRDAAQAVDLADDPLFVFIVQMKEPPYLVTTVQLDAETQRVGRELAEQAMATFRDCSEVGYWPGFADDDIPEISLPSWAIRQHDNS